MNKNGDISNIAKQATQNAYDISLTYILLGFSLVAAIAWTDAVRFFIKTYVRIPGNKGMYHILYAIVSTIIAVLAWDLTRRYLSRNIKDVPIIGVVG